MNLKFGLLLFAICIIAPVYSYNDAARAYLINFFNNLRKNPDPPAANMNELKYDACLEKVVQDFQDTCPGEETGNPDRQAQAVAAGCIPEGINVGETINYLPPPGGELLNAWAEEKPLYDYETNSCIDNSKCENYIEIIQASSSAVGCATLNVADCSDSEGQTIMCYFASTPTEGDKPYIAGEPCSQCESEVCNEGLCEQVATTTPPATTTAPVTTPITTETTPITTETTPITTDTTETAQISTDTTQISTDTTQIPTIVPTEPEMNTPHNHRHGHNHNHNHGHTNQGKGHKSHDHNHGNKKHDHAHKLGNNDVEGQISVGQFAGSTSSSVSYHNVTLFLLIASLIAISLM